MNIPKRPLVRTTDLSGSEIVRVPLAQAAGEAVLYAADFDALCDLGFTRNWYLNDTRSGRYVRAAMNTKGHGVGLARVIVGAGPRQIVKYHDGTPPISVGPTSGSPRGPREGRTLVS